MKWLRKFFERSDEKPARRIETDFFCLYCNAKFPNSDLDRVLAHLKPHSSKEEAEERVVKRAP
jgi:5-methylcytosine-specific restriction endonuclease McrA